MTKPSNDLTVRETAAILGVSITQVWRLIRGGELSAFVNDSIFRSERVTLLSRREVERRRVQRQGKSNG